MGETPFSDEWLYLLLAAQAGTSLVIAYIFTAMTGFYAFTAFFLTTVVLIALNNRSMLDVAMNVSAGRIGTWILFVLSSIGLTSVFTNSMDFPFAASLALSVSLMLYVYWTHYSLEPQRA